MPLEYIQIRIEDLEIMLDNKILDLNMRFGADRNIFNLIQIVSTTLQLMRHIIINIQSIQLKYERSITDGK